MIKIKDLSIKTKLLLGTFLVIIFFSALLFLSSLYFSSRIESNKLADSSGSVKNIIDILFDSNQKILSSNLEIISSKVVLKQQFIDRDREAVFDSANEIFSKLKSNANITHLYFIEPDGKIFLRVHDKNNYGDMITMETFKQTVRTDQMTTGIELGKTGFALRTFIPYKDGDKLLGYLEIGEEINHIVEEVHAKSGSQIEVIGDKKYLNLADWTYLSKKINIEEPWDAYDNYATVAEMVESENVDTCISKSSKFGDSASDNYIQTKSDNKSYFSCNLVPLKSVNDVAVGFIIYSTDITEIKNEASNSFFAIIAICISVLVLFISISIYYINRYIIKPLKLFKDGVESINSSSNLNINVAEYSKDEIGQLSHSFNLLKEKLRKTQNEIETRVKDRTADLEKLNGLMVGRELKMIELKKEVAAKKGSKVEVKSEN